MARYKTIDTSPKFLPVVLSDQLLPGTFEHAMNHVLDHEETNKYRLAPGIAGVLLDRSFCH